MVTKMLERTIEIEGLLRIIRDGNTLPETYRLLSSKASDLAECALLLEDEAKGQPDKRQSAVQIDFGTDLDAVSNNAEVQEETEEEQTEAYKALGVAEEEASKMTKEEAEEVQEEAYDVIASEKAEDDQIATSKEIAKKEAENERDMASEETGHKEATKSETETSHHPEEKEIEMDDEILFSIDEEDYSTSEGNAIEVNEVRGKRNLFEKEERLKDSSKSTEGKPVTAKKRESRLRPAFSLNDRFLYSRELFEGNMKMFDSTLDFLDGIDEYSIIEDYFYSELEWDPENRYVATFMDILRPFFKE